MPVAAETLSIVLAGGVGSRLSPLTLDRAKPAVPFGGQYRIIDFTLSNCLHSGLRQILVLSQYKSHSLHQHLRDSWSVFNPGLGEYITAVPPQLRTGQSWYSGTADAIYQNLFMVRRSGAKYVLVLSGDHIYRMDYSGMLQDHQLSGADVTVGCMEVPLNEAHAFGVMCVDSHSRIRSFREKPKRPEPTPGSTEKSLVSMGIYVFSIDVLCRELEKDSCDHESDHDFGKDLLPKMINTHHVNGYRFGQPGDEMGNYWRDVGTIDSYYQAHMDLLKEHPPLNIHCQRWPIHKRGSNAPPVQIRRDEFGQPGSVCDCLLSDGVLITGGHVNRSVLSPGVRIHSGAAVDGCVLLDDVEVGRGARLQNCIVDKGVRIPSEEVIGSHPFSDGGSFTVSDSGVVVIPKNYRFDTTARRSFVRPAEERPVLPQLL